MSASTVKIGMACKPLLKASLREFIDDTEPGILYRLSSISCRKMIATF